MGAVHRFVSNSVKRAGKGIRNPIISAIVTMYFHSMAHSFAIADRHCVIEMAHTLPLL